MSDFSAEAFHSALRRLLETTPSPPVPWVLPRYLFDKWKAEGVDMRPYQRAADRIPLS